MERRSEKEKFIPPTDPEEQFLKFGEMLADLAESNERVRQVLRGIQDRLAAHRLDKRLLERRRRIIGSRGGMDALGGFEGMTALAAACHSRAMQLVETKGIPSLDNTAKALENVQNKLDDLRLEPLEELIVDAEEAAIRRPAFGRRLAHAVEDFRAMEPEWNRQAERCGKLFLGRSESPLICILFAWTVPCAVFWMVVGFLALCIIVGIWIVSAG